MSEVRTVCCPLCQQTFTARSEEECINHMTNCNGFEQKHGAKAKEIKRVQLVNKLPFTRASAELKHRTSSYSDNGSFTEDVNEGLIEVLQWWKGIEQNHPQQPNFKLNRDNDDEKEFPRAWTQDDGTDRYIYDALLYTYIYIYILYYV